MTKSGEPLTTDHGLRTTDFGPRTTDHGLRTTDHEPRTVMIRVPNWVGDAVMALPALREMRRIFGDARITLVARPWVAGLFDGEGLADSVIPVHDAPGITHTVRNFIREARQLRRERFDVAVLFQNAFGAALLARTANVKMIAGYPTDSRSALLDFVVPFEPNYKTAHQVRYYLNIASALEKKLTGSSHVEMETLQPRLQVGREQQERVRLILEESGVRTGDAPILTLCPGATNSRAKRWLAERFAAIADQLAEQNGFYVLIVGTAGDVEVAEEVAGRMRSPATMLAGKTNIADLKGVLACTSLVVSNDTGTAHVSAALGIPTVVVFGPTEHVSTRPLSDVATVVRQDVECSPCMLRDCPIDHRCMTRVEVDDVYSAAQNLLIRSAR